MNLLVLSSHSILEYDDLRLFSRLGYDVFMPGGYSDPSHPADSNRPAVPEAPHHPELDALCHEQRERHAAVPAGPGIIDWAKADLHPDLVDWADTIIVNCFPVEWIGPQWDRIREKRVIWRTIGQSSPWTEHEMSGYEGLQVVRYSPAEKRAFSRTGAFAGEDAMIRFAKDPADYGPWIGDERVVGNVTQNLDTRGDHCGLSFWNEATAGLPVKLAGLGSERMGGTGRLSFEGITDYLRHIRVYLYMGTQPASYTLALMEALLTGTPTVSIGPADMWLPALFEGHELAPWMVDTAATAREVLPYFLTKPQDMAERESAVIREQAAATFGYDAIGPQWLDFLGAPVRELVAA